VIESVTRRSYAASRGTLHPVSATVSRHHLRSAVGHQLVVPSYRLSSYGRQAFSVAGPMWNSLTRHLRDPIHTIYLFLDD